MHRYIALVTMNGVGSSEVLQTGQTTLLRPLAAKTRTMTKAATHSLNDIYIKIFRCLGSSCVDGRGCS